MNFTQYSIFYLFLIILLQYARNPNRATQFRLRLLECGNSSQREGDILYIIDWLYFHDFILVIFILKSYKADALA